MAGECTCSEELKIRSHLDHCPRCSREMEDLQEVDSFLDLLKPEEAPAGLVNSIMEAVEKNAAQNYPRGLTLEEAPAKYSVPGILRDVATAAAVALTVFWLGAGWFGNLASSAENGISEAVKHYVNYTGMAVNRAQSSMASINNDFVNSVDEFSVFKNLKSGK